MKDEIKEKIKAYYVANDIDKILDYITNLQEENERLLKKSYKDDVIITKVIENAKEKIKRYESYIKDLKNGNYPSPTVRQERQELIFRIREQEDLLKLLNGGDEK